MANVEKGRWAVIVADTGEVSDIKRMQGGSKPELRNPDGYELEEVSHDVKVGMVRSGSGFAWPAGYDGVRGDEPGATKFDGDDERRKNPTPQPDALKPTPGSGPVAGAGVSDKTKEKNAAAAQKAASEPTRQPITPQAQKAAERAKA